MWGSSKLGADAPMNLLQPHFLVDDSHNKSRKAPVRPVDRTRTCRSRQKITNCERGKNTKSCVIILNCSPSFTKIKPMMPPATDTRGTTSVPSRSWQAASGPIQVSYTVEFCVANGLLSPDIFG